jgi:hypothetical protein
MEEEMTEFTHLKHFYCRLCTISGTTGHHGVFGHSGLVEAVTIQTNGTGGGIDGY